jgi:hypothetical protein
VEITKSDIIKLIEERKTDSFETHLWIILKRDFRPAGEIGNREVKVWRMNFWNGFFYPIFQFDLNQEGHLVNISDRINPAGRLFLILFCVLICIPWFHWIFDDFDLLEHWPQILVGFIFLGTCILIGFKIYKMEMKMQLKEIYELLDIEVEHSETEKEWNWKKILVRFIMYPLSLFFIFISIFLVIPKGGFIMAIATLTLIGLYLYSDVKIMMQKRKRK